MLDDKFGCSNKKFDVSFDAGTFKDNIIQDGRLFTWNGNVCASFASFLGEPKNGYNVCVCRVYDKDWKINLKPFYNSKSSRFDSS